MKQKQLLIRVSMYLKEGKLDKSAELHVVKGEYEVDSDGTVTLKKAMVKILKLLMKMLRLKALPLKQN